MLHYHVWFNLKPGVTEEAGFRVVREYLVPAHSVRYVVRAGDGAYVGLASEF